MRDKSIRVFFFQMELIAQTYYLHGSGVPRGSEVPHPPVAEKYFTSHASTGRSKMHSHGHKARNKEINNVCFLSLFR